MATTDQIAELRRHIAEPTNTAPWTDDVLNAMIDGMGVRPAAVSIWEAKAADVAHLVDISEGGSTRKASDVYKNYLAMAASFRAADDGSGGVPAASASRTRAGVRA